MYFRDYGELNYIDIEEYCSDPWGYLSSAEAEDGEVYDIVINNKNMDLAYTTI